MPSIKIQVHENDQSTGEKKGTFLSPNPKIRVGYDSQVNWNLVNSGATFEVRFNGFTSPFTSNELSISDGNPRTTTRQDGLYHYTVQVKKGSDTWTIENCPEFEVTGGS